ncbi:MAG TPA: gliding motility-associated C-terminal domain-containing protein [Flavisolibacter sp.]|nr:gliding motility-associated C-terminal domain-containing protein [Flavisolibacter sp.]
MTRNLVQPLLAFFCLFVSFSSGAATIYVNINNPAPGAGTSWATAYKDLSAALAAANTGDEIWVAQGTYKPTAGSDRTISFNMKSGVSVYGGFAGTETARASRNWKLNETILSGDIGTVGVKTDNTYYVVRFTNTAINTILDGFTVEGGNGNENYPGTTVLQTYNVAGGVLVRAAGVNATAGIYRCVIRNNFGVYGGGICTYSSGTGATGLCYIDECTFTGNEGVLGGGYGVVALGGAKTDSYIRSSLFLANTATLGKAVGLDGDGANSECRTKITNCVFYNHAQPVFCNLMQNSGSSRADVANSAVYRAAGNYTAVLQNQGTATNAEFTFNACALQLAAPGAGNINSNPRFVSPATGDFHILPCSPLIDAGDNGAEYLPAVDMDGDARIQAGTVDIGLDEQLEAITPLPTNIPSPVYCQGSPTTALTATGTSLRWYASNGTPIVGTPTPSSASAGTTTYLVTQTDAIGCESAAASLVVTINPRPAAPAVTALSYCAGETVPALNATGTNLLWYSAAAGGSGSSTAPLPSTAAPGTFNYYVSQTNANACESPRAALAVTIKALPAVPVVSNQTYCQSAPPAALTATGSNLSWYTVPAGGTASTSAPTPSTASAGSTSYYVSQTSDGCESPRAAINVLVHPQPAAPLVSSVSYCLNAAPNSLTAQGTDLRWYTSLGSGPASLTAPTPSTATAGTTDYYVSQVSTDGCEGPKALINVEVFALPAAPVTLPLTYCEGSPAQSLTAQGSGLLWYGSASGGPGDVTAPIPSTASIGVNTFYVSQTDANSCESQRATLQVTVNPRPPLPLVSAVSYCQGTGAAALTAAGSGLLWYDAASGGMASSTAPVPSTAVAGSTNYWVTQTGANGCESERAILPVSINALPPAPQTNDIFYCQGAAPAALAASGTQLLWYSSAAGGAGDAMPPTPSTTAAGSLTYYVSASDANGCESARMPLTVTVHALPGLPQVQDLAFCEGAPTTALTATGDNLRWYGSAAGGSSLTAAPIPSTAAAGSTIYYVSQTDALGCESARASLAVTIRPLPAGPATVPVQYCQYAPSLALTASGADLLWYDNASGGSGSMAAPIPQTGIPGNTAYYVSQTDANGCESPRSPVPVTVFAQPAAPAVSPVFYCQNITPLPLTASGDGLRWYDLAAGGVGSIQAPLPSTTAAGSFSYHVSQTDLNGCESPRSELIVTVRTLPSAPTAPDPLRLCQYAPAETLQGSGAGLRWYADPVGGMPLSSAPQIATGVAGTQTFYFSQTDINGCEGPRAPAIALVADNPRPRIALQASCVESAVNISALPTNPAAQDYDWDFAGADAVSGTGAGPLTATWNTAGLYTVTLTTTTGNCSNTAQEVMIVYPKPVVRINSLPDPLCLGNSVTLEANGASDYVWSPSTGLSNANTDRPVLVIQQDGRYTVTGTDQRGCSNTASVDVVVNNNCLEYFLPSGFTPNGDGLNDLFRVISFDTPKQFELHIFDRWGREVFRSNDIQKGWNGLAGDRQMPNGAYAYVAIITTSQGQVVKKKGTISLLR